MSESKSGWAEGTVAEHAVTGETVAKAKWEYWTEVGEEEEFASFETGDVVRLNSGGPPMTVSGRKAKGGLITCEWFGDDGSGMELPLRWQGEPEMLTLADDDYLEDEWWDSPTVGPVTVDVAVKPVRWPFWVVCLVLLAACVGVLAFAK